MIFLSSSRLRLRRFEAGDLNALYQLNSSPAVMRYIGPVKTKAECQVRLDKALRTYEEGEGLGKWAAIEKQSNAFIGWFVLNYLDNTKEIEIGYRLLESFWGKGYATEMSRTLLDYGFNTLHLKTIVGIARPDNLASLRVLEKIGLCYKGNRYFYDTDVRYYALRNEEYQVRSCAFDR